MRVNMLLESFRLSRRVSGQRGAEISVYCCSLPRRESVVRPSERVQWWLERLLQWFWRMWSVSEIAERVSSLWPDFDLCMFARNVLYICRCMMVIEVMTGPVFQPKAQEKEVDPFHLVQKTEDTESIYDESRPEKVLSLESTLLSNATCAYLLSSNVSWARDQWCNLRTLWPESVGIDSVWLVSKTSAAHKTARVQWNDKMRAFHCKRKFDSVEFSCEVPNFDLVALVCVVKCGPSKVESCRIHRGEWWRSCRLDVPWSI